LLGLRTEPALLPPPADTDSEDRILCALLNGWCTTLELWPLEAAHFFTEFRRSLFVAVRELERRREPVTVDSVYRELQRSGVFGPVVDELRTVRDCQPFSTARQLRESAERVVELCKLRRLSEQVQRFDAKVRLGELTFQGALQELERYVREARS
jgi:replicative DNA helicase